MKTAAKFLLSTVAVLAVLSLATVIASYKVSADALTRDDVKGIVKETLLEQPEIIVEAMAKFQEKQAQGQQQQSSQKVKDHLKELTQDPTSPVAGNPNGDVTVVEFFDYHCGYCKRLYPEVAKLIQEDANVRVVFKEYPILGAGSMLAAKAATAVFALNPDKYFAMHSALMQHSGEYDEASVLEMAGKLGVDKAALKAEMAKPETEKTIESKIGLGMTIGIQGTPALVIGEELIPGAIAYDDLKAKVDALRKK